MNVNTITVEQDTAIAKVAELKALKKSQRTEEDERLLSVYDAVRKHNSRVLDITVAFKQTGLNELHQPRLAIAAGDWKTVHFWNWKRYGNGTFWDKSRNVRGHVGQIQLPSGTFPVFDNYDQLSLKSAVPYVPANVRPKYHLRNYHILFEVEKWEEYPVDPFLLKRVAGSLFIVLAEWELTELEASILGSMRSGN
jgi:hypothetical protein